MASREQPIDPDEQLRRLCVDAELETVFQPMIELESNDCFAYEALTRFPLLPARTTSEWFATATELGVGAELELAAISAAISHLRDFPAGAVLAINVSPAVALTDEFFERVAPVAERLIIELTEHEPVEDYEALVDVLSHLRGLGARIAIDDVGAGFASLRHILRLAPDVLKLDPSLTHGVETDPGSRALTSALVDFARNTGALITAEGIETESELDLLRELGVDHGQGYLLGRPGPFAPHLN
jgi:EAL domain-containing protein (putative c-di-GMP-specific phosphodiesterase class I)